MRPTAVPAALNEPSVTAVGATSAPAELALVPEATPAAETPAPSPESAAPSEPVPEAGSDSAVAPETPPSQP